MEQSTQIHLSEDAPGASRTVSRALMRGLEAGRFVPGQRLVETDLAAQFGVGRNAVREAIQWLAALGMIDVSRYRSPAFRLLGKDEAVEVLEAIAAIIGVAARAAALGYRAAEHGALLSQAMTELERAEEADAFARARRHFYGTLLAVGGNRELPRLFRVSGLQILYAQYRTAGSRRLCLPDFRAIAAAVAKRDAGRAEAAAHSHVDTVRGAISGVGSPPAGSER